MQKNGGSGIRLDYKFVVITALFAIELKAIYSQW